MKEKKTSSGVVTYDTVETLNGKKCFHGRHRDGLFLQDWTILVAGKGGRWGISSVDRNGYFGKTQSDFVSNELKDGDMLAIPGSVALFMSLVMIPLW